MKCLTTLLLFLAPVTLAFGTTVMPRQFTAPTRYGDVLLFAHSSGSRLYAVDPGTNADVWTWSCGGRLVRTRPTVVGDIAYIWAGASHDDSRACAVDCRTGKSVWETRDGGWTFDSPEVCGDIVLFPVEAELNEVHAFDRATGTPMWVHKGGKLIVAFQQSAVISQEGDRELVILDVTTGKEEFSTPLPQSFFATPRGCCSDDGIAAIGCAGVILALDIPGRKLLWQKATGRKRLFPSVNLDTLYLLSAEWASRGDEEPQVLELWSLRTGAEIRRVTLTANGGTHYPVLFFRDVVIVPSGGRLTGLDRTSWKEIWSDYSGDLNGMVQDGESFFIGTTGPVLAQYDAATNKEVWVYRRDRPEDDARHEPCHRKKASPDNTPKFFLVPMTISALVVALGIGWFMFNRTKQSLGN